MLRAHVQQARFSLLNELQVSRTLRAGASSLAASLWLGLRLELLACSMVAAIGLLAVAAAQGWGPPVSPGLLGLVLAYALPITGILNGVLTSSAETEQEMVAVERVAQYMAVPAQVGCCRCFLWLCTCAVLSFTMHHRPTCCRQQCQSSPKAC